MWEVGSYGCHFDGLDEADTMARTRREGGRKEGREGGQGRTSQGHRVTEALKGRVEEAGVA